MENALKFDLKSHLHQRQRFCTKTVQPLNCIIFSSVVDPPYNTGHDFIYRDSFKQSEDEFNEEIGMYDEEGNRLFQNTDSNGRFHSDWCSMIYARLKLARNLLTDDGVIFISIDGHELEILEIICNEVFSKTNSIGIIVLQTATDNNPTQINEEHEYMICYAKNKTNLLPWYRISEAAEEIQKQYEKIKKNEHDIAKIQSKLREWINNNKEMLSQVAHYNCVDDKGVYSASSNSSNPHPGGYMYDILHYETQLPCPKPANGWRWPEKTFLKLAKEGEVHWGNDHTTQPHIKKRLSTAKEQLKSMIYEDNRAETKMLSQLFDGKKIFDNPKPHKVLARIVDFVSNKNDIILDFFSGSATTAHAVMQLNAEDGGNRKFIMVQLPEECNEKSEAYKAGYKNICEIGKERIRRAGEKIKAEIEKENQQISIDAEPKKVPDIGFRVLKIDSTNMKDVYYGAGEITQMSLDDMVSNIKDDRTDLDLLYGVLTDWSLPLGEKHEIMDIDGVRVHNYDDLSLIACFEENVPESVIRKIAALEPLRAVFRDSSFADSPSRINVEEIFKLKAPTTKVKVI